tara:strand:+ start:181 stop:375 length:195 start_codon:yes stop_codon:yes gene_type:complete
MISFEVTYEPKAHFVDTRLFGGRYATIEQANEKKARLEADRFPNVRVDRSTAPMDTYPNGGEPA